MDPILIGAAVAGVAGAALLTGGIVVSVRNRGESAEAYLRGFEEPDRPAAATNEYEQRLERPLVERVFSPISARVVGAVAKLTPSDHRVSVRTRLAQAGLDFRRRPEELIAAEVVGAVAGALLGMALWVTGAFRPSLSLLILVFLIILGAAAPMVWLNRKVEERMEGIRSDLPDTLDLLAISVEAGVGLEGALEVVTQRIQSPLSDEIARMLQEMGLGLSRHDALVNLKQRSQVPELSSFVGALIQADALGMPLARVLKTQATEMRAKRRQWARERAAKLPVKILFPLVLCIFPAVLVVVIGPAASKIGGVFG